MEQSPTWEANSQPASQSIHNSLPMIPILSQMRPVHIPLLSFPKTYFNIILPSTPGISEWS
jgi:hypothetical protein